MVINQKKVRFIMIKLFEPHVTDDEINAVIEVIKSKNWASGAGGERVIEFEEKFNEYIGSKQTVALNSGTAALHLALSLLDIRGKIVFIPSLSFVSTAHAVIYNEGIPVFVDIDEKSLCIDPEDLQRKIQTSQGTAAGLIPVHFGGMPSDMNSLKDICDAYNIHLIDDAAHSCGATYRGRRIGSFEEMSCFSFHPVKNLSMPTGGAITINSTYADMAKKNLNSFRWCGINNRKGPFYDVTSISPNYYMNEVSAAIGLVQLDKLDRLNRRRSEIANKYCSEINAERKMGYNADCVYHLFWIIVEQREKFLEFMRKKNIEVGTHYRPIHTMSAYDQFNTERMAITDNIGKRIVTLPIHPNLSDDQVKFIIETVNSFLGEFT
jgi:dTDP-4-amino-4,6-dideoxygalactose transaminase